jgi:hypothetical protein
LTLIRFGYIIHSIETDKEDLKMRTKRYISGLDNSRKIRVICNGVGFYTTVKGAFDMAFHDQRVAVTSVLTSLGNDQYLPEGKRPTGLGTHVKVFNHEGKQVSVEVQVDLM